MTAQLKEMQSPKFLIHSNFYIREKREHSGISAVDRAAVPV